MDHSKARAKIVDAMRAFIREEHAKCSDKFCIVSHMDESDALTIIYAISTSNAPVPIEMGGIMLSVRPSYDFLGCLMEAYLATYATPEDRVLAMRNIEREVAVKFPQFAGDRSMFHHVSAAN